MSGRDDQDASPLAGDGTEIAAPSPIPSWQHEHPEYVYTAIKPRTTSYVWAARRVIASPSLPMTIKERSDRWATFAGLAAVSGLIVGGVAGTVVPVLGTIFGGVIGALVGLAIGTVFGWLPARRAAKPVFWWCTGLSAAVAAVGVICIWTSFSSPLGGLYNLGVLITFAGSVLTFCITGLVCSFRLPAHFPQLPVTVCHGCRYDRTGVPMGAPCPECGLPGAVLEPRRFIEACPKCRYDRSGIPLSSPCPECGSVVIDEEAMAGETQTESAPETVAPHDRAV